MQNAELHADVVVQAQTDGLTGLQPRHVHGRPATGRAERRSIWPDHARPRRLQGFNDTLGHPAVIGSSRP
jgi:hypothetical protein